MAVGKRIPSLKAIVFADRNGSELLPLTTKTCVSLLPIAAKPLIEHTLETLSAAKNIHHVILVISPAAEQIERYLTSGEQWGMTLDYVLSRGQESPAQILERLGNWLTEDEYLLVRGDILQSLDVNAFLTTAYALPDKPTVLATIEGYNSGICLIHKRKEASLPWCASDILQWHAPVFKKPLLESPFELEHKGSFQLLPVAGRVNLLDSLPSYHRANIEVTKNLFPMLVLRAQQIHEDLKVGRLSKVAKHNKGLVGSYCRIHDKAHLEEDVVLSDTVIIDRYASLKNTVVLPDTYIGEAVELRNAIVWGDILIRVDSGAVLQVVDNFLLTDIRASSSELFTRLLNRILGLLVCFGSLPLWPLAFLLAFWQQPRNPLCRIKLRSNLTQLDAAGIECPLDFTAYEWATDISILRHLPKLLAVIQGHIYMVGVSPQTPEQIDALTEPWERVRLNAPIGLIGPAQLQVPTGAPLEESLFEDAYYAQTRHLGTDFLWLLRGLFACFSQQAWRAFPER